MDTEKAEARAMTYMEVEKLREAGLDPVTLRDENTGEKRAAEIVAWVAKNIYGEEKVGNFTYPEIMRLVADTYKLTFPEDMKF